MIFSIWIRRSWPDSVSRLFSPTTAVHRAGNGKLNISLDWKWKKKGIMFRGGFVVNRSRLYLLMQCAADSTQNSSIRTPPHQWPRNPNVGCSTSNETCQGNSPSVVTLPSIIRGERPTFSIRGSRRNDFVPQSAREINEWISGVRINAAAVC